MMEFKERIFSDEIKRLTPVLSKETSERLSKAYLIGDETTRKRIIEMLDIIKASILADPELKDAPLLEPPPQDGLRSPVSALTDGQSLLIDSSREMEIGDLVYGRKTAGKMRWDEDTFMTHVGIFGSSGYGKTNLSYLLVKNLSDKGVPVIIFDFSKKNYRDLCQTDLISRIQVFTVGSNVAPFKFNPLKPPAGINRTQWTKEFAEIFDHAYWLLGGGRHIILKALNELYERNDRPLLTDLKKYIETSPTMTTREKNWTSTSLRPLESLCMKETGEIFETADGIRLSSLFEPGKITVLELDSLSTNDKTFFIEITLQWIRDWLLAEGEREKLQGVIILEEAHHILNREKSKKIGSETVMDLVFREMRELGLGIVYLDQHPSMVSYPALGNTSTHVYMNLGLDTRYSSDIQDASNMLGLEDEYQEYLRRLPVGSAFVLMRHSAWTKPFNASFPLIQIKKGLIKDGDVSRLMKQRTGIDEPVELDDTQLEIIKLIGSGEGVFTSQIYKPLKLSGSAFKEKIASLLRDGTVGTREVRLEKTRANYYFLTDKGEELFLEKYPDEKQTTKDISEDAKKLFESLGWKFAQDGNKFEIEADEKSIAVKILSHFDREAIKNSIESGAYYLCAAPEIRNILLQCAAKSNPEEKVKISVAILGEFNKKGFVEFIV